MRYLTISPRAAGRLVLLFWMTALVLAGLHLRGCAPQTAVSVQEGGYYAGQLGAVDRAYLWIERSPGEITANLSLAPGETFGIPEPTVDSNRTLVLPLVRWNRDADEPETNLTLVGGIRTSPPGFSAYWIDALTSQTGRFELPRIARTCRLERTSLSRIAGRRNYFRGTFPDFDSTSPFHKHISRKLRRNLEHQAARFGAPRFGEIVQWLRDRVGGHRGRGIDSEFTAECRLDLELYSDDLVSVVLDQNAHTGGAHGNTYLSTLNFVRAGNRAIEFQLEDLFVEDSGWEQSLVALVWQNLWDQGASDVRDGYAELSADKLRFTMRGEGLRFWFEPYEVGCYAEGAYCAFVPWEAVRRHLRPDGPARLPSSTK